MAPKETSRTYDATPADVYAAVERAVDAGGHEGEARRSRHAAWSTATTGVTIWSWGERVDRVRVTPKRVRLRSTVTIAIALKFQVFGWGQQQRVADGLLDEIGRQVAAPAPPPPPFTPPPPPPPD